MSLKRPPPPPRRTVPPPPPPSIPLERDDDDASGTPIKGIADRIANLRLGHLGAQSPPTPPPSRHSLLLRRAPETETRITLEQQEFPPPVPSRATRPSNHDVDLARLLARKPPPPPVKRKSLSPSSDPPRRRIPPPPVRLPTPPPEPEPEEAEEADESWASPQEQGESCIKCRDFSAPDAHAALFPREYVTSLDNLAYDLTEPFPYETDKARAIFTWLHHNIAYDAVSFLSGNVQPASPESTLSSGLAVCDGYAGLFKGLGERVGLQVHRVVGHGKGLGYTAMGPDDPLPQESSNHAWNCVLLDGEWRLIDSCWGSGQLEGSTYKPRFSPVWFTSTPQEFGKRHFPTDRSFQLIGDEDGGPVTWEEYISEPEGPLIYRDFYELDLLPDRLHPFTKTLQSGQWVDFHLFKRCEHMSTAEADNFIFILHLSDGTRTPFHLNEAGGWSAQLYIPRGVQEVALNSVKVVDGQDALGLGIDGWNQSYGRKGMSFGGLVKWLVE